MQEISRILVQARKNKGIDLEQVAKDTSISKMFLEGLENDDYSDFPAETYVVGFLRNYANYLELDADKIVKLYTQTKIQESQIPTEVILNNESRNKKTFWVVLGVFLFLVLIALFVFVFTKKTFPTKRESERGAKVGLDSSNASSRVKNAEGTSSKSETEIITENKNQNYKITEGQYKNRFFEGDSFSVNVDEKDYTFKIKKTFSELELETENLGTQLIKLGESLQLDLDNDAVPDLEVGVGDIDKTDAKKGVLLLIATGDNIKTGTNVALVSESGTSSQNYVTVFEGASAFPVTMNITFRNYCFFRYEIDKANRKEFYYQKNAHISIYANNGFRIWASNGNALRIELVGAGRTVELDLTKPGEVLVQDIKWIKDEATNKYKFVVINVD